jgi:hypothetical protein
VQKKWLLCEEHRLALMKMPTNLSKWVLCLFHIMNIRYFMRCWNEARKAMSSYSLPQVYPSTI